MQYFGFYFISFEYVSLEAECRVCVLGGNIEEYGSKLYVIQFYSVGCYRNRRAELQWANSRGT